MAGLVIKELKLTSMALIKEYIRAKGLNPEQILTREALVDGATTYIGPDELLDQQATILRPVFIDLIDQDVKSATKIVQR